MPLPNESGSTMNQGAPIGSQSNGLPPADMSSPMGNTNTGGGPAEMGGGMPETRTVAPMTEVYRKLTEKEFDDHVDKLVYGKNTNTSNDNTNNNVNKAIIAENINIADDHNKITEEMINEIDTFINESNNIKTENNNDDNIDFDIIDNNQLL
jgi:hypothetical protein